MLIDVVYAYTLGLLSILCLVMKLLHEGGGGTGVSRAPSEITAAVESMQRMARSGIPLGYEVDILSS